MGYSDAYPGGYGGAGDVVTSLFIETTAGVWYDATDALISGNVTRGRQNQLDRYQAGTAEVLLDNDDRKFDPTYAASPLNGHILPMKRVQLRNTYAGVTYPMFTGYADRWTQNRPGPHRGTTSLAATDGFKVLERTRMGRSVYDNLILADDPEVYWRLGEVKTAGADAALRALNAGTLATAADGIYVGPPEMGGEGLIVKDPGSSIGITNSAAAPGTGAMGVRIDAADFNIIPDAGASFVLEAWCIPQTLPGTNGTLFIQRDAGGTVRVHVYYTAGNTFVVNNFVDAAAPSVSTSPTTFPTHARYHIVARTVPGEASKLWVNGQLFTGDVVSPGAWAAPGEFLLGHLPTTPAINWSGLVSHVAVWRGAAAVAFDSTTVAAHYAAGTTPWDDDLAGARVTRVLDTAGWPAGDRDIDTGQTTLQSAEINMSALEHLQKVADTEFGNLYVTAGGVVRFEDRTNVVNQPVLFAFSDAAGAGLPVTFSNPEISDEQIRNDVTVSRLDGTAQTVTDTTSVATYLTSSYTRDGLYHDDDAHSRYLAQFILNAYKDPVERVSNMAVNPYRNPATLWPAILGLELTDRVTLTETPQWVTPAVARTLVVEGISHSFSAKAWEASFNLSESTAATQAYWELGVAGYSELGETTRLYF